MGFYKIKNDKESGGDFTVFCLKAGTKFEIGSEIVELEEDADFIIRRPLQRDAIVDLIVSSGNASVNSVNFPFKETRDGVHYDVKYGGRGQRIETVIEKGAEKKTEAAKPAPKPASTESGKGTKPVKIESDPKPGSGGLKPAGQAGTGDSAFPDGKVNK